MNVTGRGLAGNWTMEQTPQSSHGERPNPIAGRPVSPLDAAEVENSDSAGTVPLRIDEDDRYSRLRLISWWKQERLTSARILVVGAGALGNEVMKNLALVGVGITYLIDLDVVEPS